MKRIILLATVLMMFVLAVPAQKSTIIKGVLNEYAVQKVDYMQSLIKFTDVQAGQLKELELNYLLGVQKVENCKWGNQQKKVDKLKVKKDKQLQEILTREQYLKYDAVERNVIKKYPLWAVEK